MKFYFTYGTEGQPFRGGWTIVIAPNKEIACGAFRAVHPDKVKGLLNCSSVYTEQEFRDYGFEDDPDGNWGAFCHEIIQVTVQQFVPSIREEIQA